MCDDRVETVLNIHIPELDRHILRTEEQRLNEEHVRLVCYLEMRTDWLFMMITLVTGALWPRRR